MDADENALAKLLAKNVKALRQAKGWTQADLAEEVGVSPHYVAVLETARRLPTLRTLLTFAQALGISVDRLLAPKDEDWAERVSQLVSGLPDQAKPLIEGLLEVAKRESLLMMKEKGKR
jgi:transcriptional regulator with XRE-family HTH domain